MPLSETHYPDSYYYHSANQIKDRPYLQEDIKTEVCIIGAGYTGLLSAINLAEKGYKVVVLEANRVGWGASGRNGGHVGSGHNKKIHQLDKDYGESLARDLWNLSEEAKSVVEEESNCMRSVVILNEVMHQFQMTLMMIRRIAIMLKN